MTMILRHEFSPRGPGRTGLIAVIGMALHTLAASATNAPAPATSAPTKPVFPTRLQCAPDDLNHASVSVDAAGVPVQASIYLAAGTHECGLTTAGAALAQPDGAWRFEWRDQDQGDQRYRLTVRRAGADGYTIATEPRRCGTLELPASVTLSPKGKGCQASVDRALAFVPFWRDLREAVARRDGERLQQLALPQLLFAEGPDLMKAPAALLRGGAACIDIVTTPTSGKRLGQLLRTIEVPRLDGPPFEFDGKSSVSVDGAMTALWTTAGWRIESFNASRGVFSQCGPKG
ncbi:MAG: hypothetical protein J7598_05205 [Mitsuaria chitosanitabida]|nr:hypothetical protein [Roseateles chitosanitabidus]